MAVHPKARVFLGGENAGGSIDLDRFLDLHGGALLANARRHSENATDADDAYQRALEILLTKRPDTDDFEQLAAWTHTVVRNEALQLLRRKRHELNTAFDEISEGWLGEAAPAEEVHLEHDEVRRAREALGRLNPNQARCLLLRAEELGYPEICEQTGFSYAKVNRLLSEGRKALLVQVGLIESGAECRRVFPVLSMIADGEAPPHELSDAQSHLNNCSACKATLRDMRAAPQELASAFPIGFAAAAEQRDYFWQLLEQIQNVANSIYERVVGNPVFAGQWAETVTAKKLAGTAAIMAALVGGGVVAERSIDGSTGELRPVVPRVAAGDRGVSSLPDALTDSPQSLDSRSAARRAESAGETELFEAASTTGEGFDGTTAADDGFAADPNDVIPEGAPEDTGLGVEGLTP